MIRKKKKNQKRAQPRKQSDVAVPFLEHIVELRQRFFYCAVSVTVIAVLTYFIQQSIVSVLLRPAHGQQFIYTSPGGGIDFLFRVCIYTGIVFSVPLIVYHFLRYIEPLMYEESMRFIVIGSFVSGLLAIGGILFGYYIGLPAVLHFLLHQFVTNQIKPLVTIQSYISFVMIYVIGSALLFQVPLILLFINRVRPLKPKKLFHYEKFVLLAAFIIAAMMNPTPNLISQLMLAGPIFLMYQVGIMLVWLVNKRHKKAPHVTALIEKDIEAQAGRLLRASQAKTVKLAEDISGNLSLTPETVPDTVSAEDPDMQAAPRAPLINRPIQRRLYVNDIIRPTSQ